MILDGLQLAAHGGLGHKQFLARFGETQVARSRLESPQQVERGQIAALFMYSINSCERFSNIV